MENPQSLLEDLLPRYDVNEIHETWVAAAPAAVFAAVRAVTAAEVRLLRPLMAIRMLLPRLLRRATALGSTGPLLDEFVREGFVVLGERPDAEFVFGGIGRFWRLVDEDTIRAVETADEFRAFADPGYAKAAVTFLITADAGGSRVVTETRIVGTSPEATGRFRRYWRVVGPGSALIRRSWLAAIRRRALCG